MFKPKEERDGCGFRESLHEGLDEVSKLMLKTADLIERRGLPGCAIEDGKGCVIVSFAEVGGDFGQSEQMNARMHKHVGRLTDWSDKAGREGRAHEVVAKLRAVALGG
jgi:hypothetical protein